MELKSNAFMRMQLQDMARVLSRDPLLELHFSKHSHLDRHHSRLYVSHFWEDVQPSEHGWAGLKSDVMLHAFGTVRFSDPAVISEYLNLWSDGPLPSFRRQLFAMLEQWRLEQCVISLRRGSRRWFRIRQHKLADYFRIRMRMHVRHREDADALLLALYAAGPKGTGRATEADSIPGYSTLFERMRKGISQLYSTRDAARLCEQMAAVADQSIKDDMRGRYFTIGEGLAARPPSPQHHKPHQKAPYPERKDAANAMANKHIERSDGSGWMLTNEASDAIRSDGGLFDAGQATDKTPVHAGDRQAEKRNADSESGTAAAERFVQANPVRAGNVNENARSIWLPPPEYGSSELNRYRQIENEVSIYTKRIRRTIQLSLDKTRNSGGGSLTAGRLGNKWHRILTDDDPRLFYRKQMPSHHLDTAFMLLVDCSASMHDKMEETKKGIVLFHEALRSLMVRHAIVGFWEDAQVGKKDRWPNYFYPVVDFQTSMTVDAGPRIMSLEPKQDNRDGYAIRETSALLNARPEKRKVMIVFSDGEPAAAGYHEEGIMDTYDAVTESRRRGLEVIGVFLAQGDVLDQDREMMRQLYGQYSLIVPRVDQLPDQLTPVLRQLLLHTIR